MVSTKYGQFSNNIVLMMVPLFQVGDSDERSFSGIVNREPFHNTLYLIDIDKPFLSFIENL